MTTEQQQTEYPFDTDVLEKGSYVQPETIERAYGVRRSDKNYGLTLMRAGDFVEGRFLDRGEVVTIESHKDGLRILTDEEQVSYNEARDKHHLRGLGRVQRRRLGADRSKIASDELRARHDTNCVRAGMRIQAIRAAERAPLPQPHLTARLTPGRLSDRQDPPPPTEQTDPPRARRRQQRAR
jgi:hypothetical protein